MADDISLSDGINAELDGRKIQRLIDIGMVSEEEVTNAPAVELVITCTCPGWPDFTDDYRCKECGAQWDRVEE